MVGSDSVGPACRVILITLELSQPPMFCHIKRFYNLLIQSCPFSLDYVRTHCKSAFVLLTLPALSHFILCGSLHSALSLGDDFACFISNMSTRQLSLPIVASVRQCNLAAMHKPFMKLNKPLNSNYNQKLFAVHPLKSTKILKKKKHEPPPLANSPRASESLNATVRIWILVHR